MPPCWIHTLLDIIAFGRELSWIHRSKDRHYLELGPNHREREHPLYVELKRCSREGFSFLEILDTASSVITDKAKKFEVFVQEKGHISREKARVCALFYASYLFHDLFDLLWDDLPYEEREVYKAGIREIWLNPREFSNLFLPETFEAYFTSNEYKAQREYVTGQNHYHVSLQKLDDFLTYQKKLRFKKI